MRTPPISYTPPSYIPSELRVGERVVPIETVPLGSPEPWPTRMVEFIQDHPERLDLTRLKRPGGWTSKWIGELLLFGLLFLPALAMSVLLAMAIGLIFGLGEWALLMGPVIGFMAVGYVFYKLLKGNPDRRTRFDRASQQLTVEERLRRSSDYRTVATKPLSSVVGVQVVFTGHHTWSTSETGGCYFSYEMNLILDDGTRFHLCTHSDWQWFRREGRRLAEFLEVPFIDQLAWHAN